MSENVDSEGDRLLYLFASKSHELYARDIYNSLALPPDFTIQFRYRQVWWGPEIKKLIQDNDLDHLTGKEALIVASPSNEVDEDEVIDYKSKYTFYPLRKANVIDAFDRGKSIHLYLRLSGELVDYNHYYSNNEDLDGEIEDDNRINIHKKILGINFYPRRSNEDDDNDAFVCFQQDIDLEFNNVSENADDHSHWSGDSCESVWNTAVEEIANHQAFSGTLFYRVRRVLQMEKGHSDRIYPKQIHSKKHVGFQLSSGHQYLMELSLSFAGSPPEGAKDHDLKLTCSEKIQIIPSKFDLGFRTDQREIILDPNTGIQPLNSSLIIDSSAEFSTTQLDIPLHVKPSWKRRLGPYLLLFVGIMIIVASPYIVDLGHFLYSSIIGGDLPLINRINGELISRLSGTALSVYAMQLHGVFSSDN